MTVLVNKNHIIKTASGSFIKDSTFEIDFPYEHESSVLEVYIVNNYGILLDTWTGTSNYSITNIDDAARPNVYGVFTYNVDWNLYATYGVSEVNVIVKRALPNLQKLPFNDQLLIADTVERLMDNLTMQLQDLLASTAIRLPEWDLIDSANLVLPGAAGRAGKVIGFNEIGTEIRLMDPGGSSDIRALRQPAEEVANPTFIVSIPIRRGKLLGFADSETADVEMVFVGAGLSLAADSHLQIHLMSLDGNPLYFNEGGALSISMGVSGYIEGEPPVYHSGKLGVVKGGPLQFNLFFNPNTGIVQSVDSNVYIVPNQGGLWAPWYVEGPGITVSAPYWPTADHTSPHVIELNPPNYDMSTEKWTIGGVQPGANISIKDVQHLDGTISLGVLTAEPAHLSGTTKVPGAVYPTGDGVTYDEDTGLLTITQGTYTLPPATNTTLGGVVVPTGEGLEVDADGNLKNTNPTPYSLPTASDTTLGGVKVGTGLAISEGVLASTNPTPYSLPTASDTVLGGVKVGVGLAISDGFLSNSNPTPYSLPVATVGELGGVKPDGSTITVTGDGVISAAAVPYTAADGIVVDNANHTIGLKTASGGQLGGVKVGNGLQISSAGVLSTLSADSVKQLNFKGVNGVTVTKRDYAFVDKQVVNSYKFTTSITLDGKVFIVGEHGYIYYRPANNLTGWVDLSVNYSGAPQFIFFDGGSGYLTGGYDLLKYRYSLYGDWADPSFPTSLSGLLQMGVVSINGRYFVYGGYDGVGKIAGGYSINSFSNYTTLEDCSTFIDGKTISINGTVQYVAFMDAQGGFAFTNGNDLGQFSTLDVHYPKDTFLPRKFIWDGSEMYVWAYDTSDMHAVLLKSDDFDFFSENWFVVVAEFPAYESITDLRYQNGIFTVAGLTYIYDSQDGVTWRQIMDSEALGLGKLNFVAANMAVGLCFADNGTEFKYENGKWITNVTGLNAVPGNVAGYADSADGVYRVVVSNKLDNVKGNYIYVQKSGEGWVEKNTILMSGQFNRIRYRAGSSFLLMGNDGDNTPNKCLQYFDAETGELSGEGHSRVSAYDYGAWTTVFGSYEIMSGCVTTNSGVRIFWKPANEVIWNYWYSDNNTSCKAKTAAVGMGGEIVVWSVWSDNTTDQNHYILYAKKEDFPNNYYEGGVVTPSVSMQLPNFIFNDALPDGEGANHCWLDIDWNGQFFLMVREGGGLVRITLDYNNNPEKVVFVDVLRGVTGILGLNWDGGKWVVVTKSTVYVSEDVWGESWVEVPFYEEGVSGALTFGELSRDKSRLVLGFTNMQLGSGVRDSVIEVSLDA
jgi:hypothetical protein